MVVLREKQCSHSGYIERAIVLRVPGNASEHVRAWPTKMPRLLRGMIGLRHPESQGVSSPACARGVQLEPMFLTIITAE